MKFSELLERVQGRGVKVLPPSSSVVGESGADALVGRGGRGGGAADPEIQRVCEDSRKVRAGDLFVARGGTKVDGARYIADAVSRGAVAVVCEIGQWPVVSGPLRGVAGASVENVNLACAVLAHEVAGNPTAGMKMIGITGTKGKTTVAYLMRSVLKAAGYTVGMIGTVEIDDGAKAVPAEMTTPGSVELVELFCRMRDNGVTHCVMEVSSHALHQHRVAGIDFAVAIFTNLTGDHLDYHKNMNEYAAAKAMLFQGLGQDAHAILNWDDSYALRMAAGCAANITYYSTAAIGAQRSRTLILVFIKGMIPEGMRLHVLPRLDASIDITTPLVGNHNAYNILAAFGAADVLQVPLSVTIETLSRSIGAPGRLQPVVDAISNKDVRFQVFVDYAHTHDALDNVLSALRRATMGREFPPKGGRLICLFGCGGDRDRTKRPKMGAVAERLADVVILTSDNPRTEVPGAIIEEICAGFSAGWMTAGKITIEPDRRAAIKLAIRMAKAGDVVLLAGKGHESYQIIGTTKHHFDDVEEAEAALKEKLATDKRG